MEVLIVTVAVSAPPGDLVSVAERNTLALGKRRTGMDTARRSGAPVAPPTVNQAFWGLVDATWSREELAELVALCKAMEDAYSRSACRELRAQQ
jgi:hypothetical protein